MVVKDEKEFGLRVILNYGYIIGYVVESLIGYIVVIYGEVVSIGMVVVSGLVLELGMWDE